MAPKHPKQPPDDAKAAKKNVEQGQLTRRMLVDLAAEAFAQHGYAGTTTQAIIDAAGVTKGAMYHHFPSKRHLFEAVYRSGEMLVAQRIADASGRQKDPWRQLLEGCFAYLEACQDPAWHRILRIDGPAVLGAQAWAEIDREFGVRRLLPFLQQLADTQVIRVASVEAFAYQLTGAMNEATFWIAQHHKPRWALRQSCITLEQLLSAVRGH